MWYVVINLSQTPSIGHPCVYKTCHDSLFPSFWVKLYLFVFIQGLIIVCAGSTASPHHRRKMYFVLICGIHYSKHYVKKYLGLRHNLLNCSGSNSSISDEDALTVFLAHLKAYRMELEPSVNTFKHEYL